MSDANRAAKNPANFSRLTIEQRRAIASAGGRAAHANGRAHRFTSEEARVAGKRGGSTVSSDRQHMAEIGAKGGRGKMGYRLYSTEERTAVRELSKRYIETLTRQRNLKHLSRLIGVSEKYLERVQTGIDTPGKTLASLLWLLSEHPEQLAQLEWQWAVFKSGPATPNEQNQSDSLGTMEPPDQKWQP